MKTKNLLTLSLSFVAAASAIAQTSTVDHIAAKGYTQITYMSQPGRSGMFKVMENARKNSSSTVGNQAYGFASVNNEFGGLTLYFMREGEQESSLLAMNPALKGMGMAEAMIPVTRVVYSGFQQLSRIDGWMRASSMISNVDLIERTKDSDQYTFSLPGMGMIFKITDIVSGKVGTNGVGEAQMSFFFPDGSEEVLFESGTPIHSASWVGHLFEHSTTIVKN